MNKLKAFTLMEMMVVMVVSSVAISICFACFNLIQRQFLRFKERQEAFSVHLEIDRLLTKDFSDCRHILKTQQGCSCIYDSHTVSYDFLDGMIVRSDSAQRDSFNIPLSQIEVRQTGQDVAENGEMIDELIMRFLIDEDEFSLSFQKLYGADSWLHDHRPNDPIHGLD